MSGRETSAANALQAAVFTALSGDAALSAMLGPGGIHDRLLDDPAHPYLRLAGIESRDWSTASEPGEAHDMAIEVRGGEGGHRGVQEIAARVRALLDDAGLLLSGHHLVNLRHEGTRTARDAEARGHVAAMRFRAVTEPMDEIR
ncbi:hypothetical protein ASG25_03405 [Rhizobium sp. Leaf384]|uniref:DUF3168 domain-containing protein n=1 Tax=unclassified Rhizobium TaxID=2613769 RepID=UPI000714F694|nr:MULTISPECIES: DUF3168 domain-containing protein [unclassified Rhizobium]KQR77347.1 hypothetical protein ASG03_12885 [Rhizobium sp. Leaf341]KQS77465.1 hypothetical protein ASG58_10925 [Rhizobium sp. Leaf383]KQS80628.1 hypothetical protein ASG25_03405 [Rhizobium sp. Leaf384]